MPNLSHAVFRIRLQGANNYFDNIWLASFVYLTFLRSREMRSVYFG